MQSGSLFDSRRSLNNDEFEEELELKIIAFKKIYWALRSGQNNGHLLKSNFLASKENLTPLELAMNIKTYCSENPNSRTSKAWKLAEQHYKCCNATNPDLFNEIYKYTWENTKYFGTTLFSKFTSPPVFSKEQIENGEHVRINDSNGKFNRMGFYIRHELDDNLRLNTKEIKYIQNH